MQPWRLVKKADADELQMLLVEAAVAEDAQPPDETEIARLYATAQHFYDEAEKV